MRPKRSDRHSKGCASDLLPDVGYRTWPMAMGMSIGSASGQAAPNTRSTVPAPLWMLMRPSASHAATPAASCPLCCRSLRAPTSSHLAEPPPALMTPTMPHIACSCLYFTDRESMWTSKMARPREPQMREDLVVVSSAENAPTTNGGRDTPSVRPSVRTRQRRRRSWQKRFRVGTRPLLPFSPSSSHHHHHHIDAFLRPQEPASPRQGQGP